MFTVGPLGFAVPWLLFALIGALFFIPFLGGVHLFDWDEINFAEISREMILSGDYLRVAINFEPFYQKPPLFFWFQAGGKVKKKNFLDGRDYMSIDWILGILNSGFRKVESASEN